MIFVGDGALLWRAVDHARRSGYAVDGVCTSVGGDRPPWAESVTVHETTDVNLLADELKAASTDGVVWSIDNRFLFRAPLLGTGLRIYNVHGGPLPQYRGLPLALVAHAILNGETEFAATLHEVDAGIDTGPVVDEERFPVEPDDVFEDVMLNLVEACHRLFVRAADAVAADRLPRGERRPGPGGYYGRRALTEFVRHRAHPNYVRATDLGMFEDFFPEAAAAWR
ncbi:formyltransferase family protein [Pseudonocardia sp. WMMC193]|uniref:formyltransferase family protein n=1 Tax=Pseudonocardia sp. WMMC193 TaxID=2911965 RepID=UPI001F3386EE|nr:formyltransferase family protein [Pseudonocardia sp. WMMC193]MCF7549500.1 hypothetical protein [Pseudonocardia sp. WMMC193]